MSKTIVTLCLAFSLFFVSNGHSGCQDVWIGCTGTPADDPMLGLTESIQQTLDETNFIPGMAIGIVVDGKVIFREGFGFRDIEKQLPFTPETPSYIASVTKSFVAFTAQQLSDSKQLGLDESLADVFRENEEVQTSKLSDIRMRDLLTHQSGLKNSAIDHANMFTGAQADSEMLKAFLSSEVTERDFRYSNLGYQLYGLAINYRTGSTWQQNLTERLLKPLEMQSTHFDFGKVDSDQLARPYMATENGFVELPVLKRKNTMHAAGGMVSNVDDLLTWLMVQMQDGKLDERQVFQSSAIQASRKPLATFDDSYWGYFSRTGYGLGWFVGSYQEREFVHCFGSFAGYRAHLSYMPDKDFGVVMLSNESRDGGFLPEIIAMHVYDRLLRIPNADATHKDRVANYKKIVEQRFRSGRNDIVLFGEPVATPPEIKRASFVGVYENDRFGRIKIEDPANGLRARWGNLKSWLLVNESGYFVADFVPGDWSSFELKFDQDSNNTFVIEIDGESVVFTRR